MTISTSSSPARRSSASLATSSNERSSSRPDHYTMLGTTSGGSSIGYDWKASGTWLTHHRSQHSEVTALLRTALDTLGRDHAIKGLVSPRRILEQLVRDLQSSGAPPLQVPVRVSDIAHPNFNSPAGAVELDMPLAHALKTLIELPLERLTLACEAAPLLENGIAALTSNPDLGSCEDAARAGRYVLAENLRAMLRGLDMDPPAGFALQLPSSHDRLQARAVRDANTKAVFELCRGHENRIKFTHALRQLNAALPNRPVQTEFFPVTHAVMRVPETTGRSLTPPGSFRPIDPAAVTSPHPWFGATPRTTPGSSPPAKRPRQLTEIGTSATATVRGMPDPRSSSPWTWPMPGAASAGAASAGVQRWSTASSAASNSTDAPITNAEVDALLAKSRAWRDLENQNQQVARQMLQRCGLVVPQDFKLVFPTSGSNDADLETSRRVNAVNVLRLFPADAKRKDMGTALRSLNLQFPQRPVLVTVRTVMDSREWSEYKALPAAGGQT